MTPGFTGMADDQSRCRRHAAPHSLPRAGHGRPACMPAQAAGRGAVRARHDAAGRHVQVSLMDACAALAGRADPRCGAERRQARDADHGAFRHLQDPRRLRHAHQPQRADVRVAHEGARACRRWRGPAVRRAGRAPARMPPRSTSKCRAAS